MYKKWNKEDTHIQPYHRNNDGSGVFKEEVQIFYAIKLDNGRQSSLKKAKEIELSELHNVFQRKNENADWDVLSALPKNLWSYPHCYCLYDSQC